MPAASSCAANCATKPDAEATKALAINPSLPLAHELLGEVALSRGDTAGAIRELEAERKINPLDPDLYDRLGDAYLRNGQYADAQQASEPRRPAGTERYGALHSSGRDIPQAEAADPGAALS